MCRGSRVEDCPQWPEERWCLCFSRRGGCVITGLLTVLDNVGIIVLCVYAVVNDQFWDRGYKSVETWVEGNHWDVDITLYALNVLAGIDANRQVVLVPIAAYSSLAILNAIFLIMAMCLPSPSSARGTSSHMTQKTRRRYLILPWLLQDFCTVTLVTLSFVIWAFLSFFVDVLLAILFPVLAGAILGLYIYLWRNVYATFYIEKISTSSAKASTHVTTSTCSGHNVSISSSLYRKLPSGNSRQMLV